MTSKTDFTPEAWQAILAAPAAITQLVVTASFGLGDLIKEGKAMSQQLQAFVQQPGDLPLLVALASDLKQQMDSHKVTKSTSTPEKQDAAVQKAQTIAGLKTAISAVDATATPEEAVQLKQWLYSVGDAVAKAAKEGDHFGFGGQQVSAAEEAVLVEIKTVLGLDVEPGRS
jgi:hypothetical protein